MAIRKFSRSQFEDEPRLPAPEPASENEAVGNEESFEECAARIGISISRLGGEVVARASFGGEEWAARRTGLHAEEAAISDLVTAARSFNKSDERALGD